MSTNPFDDTYRESQRPPGIAAMSSFAKSAKSVSSNMSEEEEIQLAMALSASETTEISSFSLPVGLTTSAVVNVPSFNRPVVPPQPPSQLTAHPPHHVQAPAQSTTHPPAQSTPQTPAQSTTQQQAVQKPLSTSITLHLSARGIPKLDTLSKSDPQVICYIAVVQGNAWVWQEFGRTEIIQDNHEPVFQKTFTLDYIPSIEQRLRFLVLDIDEPANPAIEKQDIIGQVLTNLGFILHEPQMTVTLPIAHEKPKRGVLTIQATAGPPMPVRAYTTPSHSTVQNQRGKLKSYNSIDEYQQFSAAAAVDYRKKDAEFAIACSRRGWQIREVIGDGACFFRSMADQLYGNQDRHAEVRAQCMAFMQQHRDLFQDFVTEDFDEYIQRKRAVSTYANNVEIQACACVHDRIIKVFKYDTEEPFADVAPFIEEGSGLKAAQKPPLMISYHRSNHFNSLVTEFYHK